MFIPISTDAWIRRTPWVNYGLILTNVLLFLLSLIAGADADRPTPLGSMVKVLEERGALEAAAPRLYQFITYQFLHANFAHVAGNMLFLWVFGNAVNTRMGGVCYLMFYLAGGVFSATIYSFRHEYPLIGASGAVAAVTSAFLVLFPRSQVTLLFWFFVIFPLRIRSLWLIVLKLILWDNVLVPRLVGGSDIAFDAHLAGYGFGFAAGAGLLAIRALPRDPFDLPALMQRAWRRWRYRSMMRSPEARQWARYGRMARPVSVEVLQTVSEKPDPVDPLTELRQRIASALADHDRNTAAELYRQLLEADPRQVLPRNQQLEVANQLCTLHRLPEAVAAYEKYLTHYPDSPEASEVHLLLGIMYARDLEQYEPAEGHLLAALGRLTDERRREQCNQWLRYVADARHRPVGPPASPGPG